MLDLTNRNRTLPMVWRRRSNGKLYGLGDIKADSVGVIRVWDMSARRASNRCLHISLERLTRTFRVEPLQPT